MSYSKLSVALAINTVLMFLISFSMLSELSHFQPNLNRFYMALMMAAPMGIIMLIVMRSMFQNRTLNALLLGIFAFVFVGSYALMRTQATIGDGQFLRSMIPHHSSAILMCEKARISDQQIERLCREIIESQKREISEMQGMLSGPGSRIQDSSARNGR